MAHPEYSRRLFDDDVSALTPEAERMLGLVVHSKAFPVLDVTVDHTRPIRFLFTCNDWDDQPAAITLLNPDGSPYSGPIPGGIFHAGPHPITGLPFVCMRGVKEYHTHTSHTNDAWSTYRGQDGMNVVGILMQLSGYWRRHVQ